MMIKVIDETGVVHWVSQDALDAASTGRRRPTEIHIHVHLHGVGELGSERAPSRIRARGAQAGKAPGYRQTGYEKVSYGLGYGLGYARAPLGYARRPVGYAELGYQTRPKAKRPRRPTRRTKRSR